MQENTSGCFFLNTVYNNNNIYIKTHWICKTTMRKCGISKAINYKNYVYKLFLSKQQDTVELCLSRSRPTFPQEVSLHILQAHSSVQYIHTANSVSNLPYLIMLITPNNLRIHGDGMIMNRLYDVTLSVAMTSRSQSLLSQPLGIITCS